MSNREYFTMRATTTSGTVRRAVAAIFSIVVTAVLAVGFLVSPAQAATYVPVSGAGSTWSQNAIDQWRSNVRQYGMVVNYAGTGSSDGRNQFRNGTVDFAVTEIPYGLKDAGVIDPAPSKSFAYMPIVAGGTSFMYNLSIAGKRVTTLRLAGDTLSKIFTGVIKYWNDPAIKKDNPGLAMPARRIVPVVRSDGSGTTAQFTNWMAKEFEPTWDAYCRSVGRPTPCGLTSFFPVKPGNGFVAQGGSLGVSGYVSQAQSDGAITYVEYSYALNTGFPVVKVLNKAGYYVGPTAQNVAVALLAAQINNNPKSPNYLQAILDGVYNNTDPRTYPLSSYSYMLVPTAVAGTFNAQKGYTLSSFANYFLCDGQQQAGLLGYSPLPKNLVQAGLDQVKRIPGVDLTKIDITKCNNPTFSASGKNLLAASAPFPAACDKQGASQCGTAAAGQNSGGNTGKTPAPGTTPTGTTPTPGATGTPSPGSTTPSGSVPGPSDSATSVPVTNSNGGNGGDPNVAAVPVSMAATPGWSTNNTLIVVAMVLLIAIVFGPPLLVRALRARKGQ